MHDPKKASLLCDAHKLVAPDANTISPLPFGLVQCLVGYGHQFFTGIISLRRKSGKAHADGNKVSIMRPLMPNAGSSHSLLNLYSQFQGSLFCGCRQNHGKFFSPIASH